MLLALCNKEHYIHLFTLTTLLKLKTCIFVKLKYYSSEIVINFFLHRRKWRTVSRHHSYPVYGQIVALCPACFAPSWTVTPPAGKLQWVHWVWAILWLWTHTHTHTHSCCWCILFSYWQVMSDLKCWTTVSLIKHYSIAAFWPSSTAQFNTVRCSSKQ